MRRRDERGGRTPVTMHIVTVARAEKGAAIVHHGDYWRAGPYVSLGYDLDRVEVEIDRLRRIKLDRHP